MAQHHRHEQLARNLCTAFVASQRRISLSYAEKRYVPKNLHGFWYELADLIWNRWAVSTETFIAPPKGEGPIQ